MVKTQTTITTVTSTTTISPAGEVSTETSTEVQAGISWPDVSSEVTAQFLSDVFKVAVKSFDIEPCGIGFIGDAFKVKMEFDGPAGDAPATCVLKFAKEDEGVRQIGVPNFKNELAYYREFAQDAPIASGKCYGAFGTEEDPTKFLLVLEDLMADGETECWPNWLLGVDDSVLRGCLFDLAKLHVKYFKSPILTNAKSLAPYRSPHLDFGEGYWSCPFHDAVLAHLFPYPEAVKLGSPEGTDGATTLKKWFCDNKDFLQFKYKSGDEEYFLHEGPHEWPAKITTGEQGLAIFKEICRVFATRPLTFIHGDGHPGNLFQKKNTGDFIWIDFQAIHAAPIGFELSQGVGLGFVDPSAEKAEQICRDYHAELARLAPEIALEYPFETLWWDFLSGMIIWGCIYTWVHLTSLPNLPNDPNKEMRLFGLRNIMPRYNKLLVELKLNEHAESILKSIK